MYSNEVLDRIDEGIDSEFTWTVATMKALTAEVRRLTEMVRIREEAIHRLNDKLDAANGAIEALENEPRDGDQGLGGLG